MTAIVWTELSRDLPHEEAKRRTPKDPSGTAYWVFSGRGHSLYVKTGVDAWRCFDKASLEACLEEYSNKPSAGARADDRCIADGIAGIPTNQARRVSTALLATTKKARTSKAMRTPREVWEALAEQGAEVVWRPVKEADVAKAEKALGIRFPPSYVELVTVHGAPALGSDRKASAEDLGFAVLVPKEVVRFTKELRDLDPDMFEDEESLPRVQAQLAKAVLFQLGCDAGEGFVFLTDTADARGEMKVGDYSHDYLEELDWRPKSKAVFPSLSASMLEVARRIADDLL